MNPLYATVAGRAGNHCEYCRAPESVFNIPFEVEHITPRSRNGSDAEENPALACRSCNLFKSDHVQSIDPETAEIVRLYHPREDHWQKHFTVDKISGQIAAIKPIGRVTIDCLKLKSGVRQQIMAFRRLCYQKRKSWSNTCDPSGRTPRCTFVISFIDPPPSN